MRAPVAYDRVLTDFAAAKPAALARVVSIVENRRAGFEDLLASLHTRVGQARRIGITGPPGAGKSTLTTCMATLYRSAGFRVGIIAVDPTSTFTGGALLGDRVRMESVALDPGIFIRSMATRGSLGGLASATRDVADVLDAYGFERILIETVGVGQSELDIARTADSVLVVLVPESGDSIQTMKAGVMEIADVFAINKADRPGADRLRQEVELMLGLRMGRVFRNIPAHHGVSLGSVNSPPSASATATVSKADEWTPPVLATVAARHEGIAAVTESLDRHFDYLERSGALRERRRNRLRERVVEAAERQIRQKLWNNPDTNAWLEDRLPDIESGVRNPFAVAEDLLKRSGELLAQSTITPTH
ncbi:MAG: methylmalonyl Co-A mutase-associated GTPase MeaB [Gemmatimonadaceae bacterium]